MVFRALEASTLSICVVNDARLCLNVNDSGSLLFVEEESQVWSLDFSSSKQSSIELIAEEAIKVSLLNRTCLGLDEGNAVGFSNCSEPEKFIFANEVGTDFYSVRTSSSNLCLSAGDFTEDISVNSTALFELCFDSDQCFETFNQSVCEDRSSAQLFNINGLDKVLEEPSPTNHPTKKPDRRGGREPFFDTPYESAYRSIFILVFLGLIGVGIWKYDLIPQHLKDLKFWGRSDEKNILEGVDLGRKEPPKADVEDTV